MSDLLEKDILCPYCNESITILLDDSIEQQEYIEDCQVCCRPIELAVSFDLQGEAAVMVKSENE